MAHAPLHHHLDIDTLHVTINSISMDRPWFWLKEGWKDMVDNFGTSVLYGAFFAALGYLILAYVSSQPYIFTAAISGFMLIGPLAAAGLYEISRRDELGQHTTLAESLHGLGRNGDSLLYFGIMLVLIVIAWERLSAILFALFYTGRPVAMSSFITDVFLSGKYWPFVIAYIGMGGVIAAVLYTLSAISIPMLMDRDTDIITAIITSVQSVLHNLATMTLWAVMLVILMAIGFGTLMIGMIIVLPLVGHATWHAYRDLVHHDN